MIEAYRDLFAGADAGEMPLRFQHPSEFVDNTVGWLGEVHHHHRLAAVVGRALAATEKWHADAPVGIHEIRDRVLVKATGTSPTCSGTADECG